MTSVNVLPIGTILYGYCAGWFGRDSYEAKRVEAVGVDWVVVRTSGGEVQFASSKDPFYIHAELARYTEQENWEGWDD